MIAGRRRVGRIANMSTSHITNLSEHELRRIHAETGVDVYALLDLLERTPAERLRIAMANARNMARLRAVTRPYDADEMIASGAFDALAILGVLHRREIQFVVIGGIAGYLLGSELLSANLDICFAADPENARQLARTLNDVHARLVGFPHDVPEIVDEHVLRRGDVFTFQTEYGVLRCLSNPAGTEGYDDLRDHAEGMEIDGLKTYVAGLADLIRMKEASSREKDRLVLVTLRAMQKLRE